MSISQAGGSLSKFSKLIAKRLSRKITDTFFPAKLIAFKNNKLTVDQGNSFFNKESTYNIIKLGPRVMDQTLNQFSGRVENIIGKAQFLEGSSKQSILKVISLEDKENSLDTKQGIIIRPIFEKLPTASDIAKQKIKRLRQK